MELSRTIDSDKRYYLDENTIDSQKELKKYYSTTITADLKTRDEKIKMIQKALDKKKAVKNSILVRHVGWGCSRIAMSFYPRLRAF